MSSIKLKGSTSGDITISAPAVAGTNTLTLPATTGSLMTSTFTGDINFDSDTLVVDSTNNRVGIGTNSPSGKLTVSDTGEDNALYVLGGIKQDDGPGNPWYLGKGILGSTGSEFLIGNGSNELLRIEQSGTVLMGQTTNPATATLVLKVSTGSANGVNAQITSNTGTSFPWSNYNASGSYVGGITCTSSSTGFPTSSDYRLKENVDYTFDATSRLKQLKPCRFNFKIDTDNTVDGFLAHEVSSIVPEAVFGEKDAMETYTDDDGNEQTRISPQSIDQSKLVPLLVKTCQEQQTIIEDLQTRITALENN